MKKPILYLLFLLSTNFLSAQGTLTFSPSVPSVTNGLVDFTFDLVGGGAEYDLLVEASFDNGTNWDVIPAADIAGQLSNVAPGNISFQWDAMASFTGQVTNDAVLRVTARHVCGTDFTFDYNGTQVTYGTVLIDYGGSVGEKCWMDRNLGAEPRPFDPVGTQTNTTTDLYGDLFQWGRGDDGHQVVDWTSSTTGDVTPTTTTLSTSDNPGHDYFIINNTHPNDWRETQNNDLWQGEAGVNNPCPNGWHVATNQELDAERQSWDTNDATGAFDSDLRWPAAGARFDINGNLSSAKVGIHFDVWSSSAGTGNTALFLTMLSSSGANMVQTGRANGKSVRCIRTVE